LHFNNKNRLP